MVSYGSREPVAHRANFNSAVGGRDPSAYMDKAARAKPVVFFVGPVHGHEVEGLTGLVNLIQVELARTGEDLFAPSWDKTEGYPKPVWREPPPAMLDAQIVEGFSWRRVAVRRRVFP